VAACGSTVQVRSEVGSGGSLLTPLPTADAAGSDSPSGAGSREPAGSGSAVAGRASGQSGTLGAGHDGAGLPAAASGGSGSVAHGISASQILLGVLVERDDAGIAAAVGASSLTGGDHVAEVTAIVRDMNAHGGILGRKIVATFQYVDTSDETKDPAGAAQAACVGLTEDKHVFAAISYLAALPSTTLFSCMARHGTPLLESDAAPQTRARYAQADPYAYGPHTVTVERMAPTLISRLRAQGYFAGWDTLRGAPGTAAVKVGILYISGDDTYRDSTTTALAAAGYRMVDTFGYQASLSSVGSDMQAAVLRFRNDGVTHVFIEEGSAVLFFAQVAENQAYRPRYGLTSLDLPAGLLATGALPKQQLAGATGTGYLPMGDVGDMTRTTSTADTSCRELMRRAGQATTDPTAVLYMQIECDDLHLILAALVRSGSPTVAGLRSGLDGLGTAFVAATVPAMTWRSSVFDAVSAVRDFHFDGNTFVYSGGLHAV